MLSDFSSARMEKKNPMIYGSEQRGVAFMNTGTVSVVFRLYKYTNQVWQSDPVSAPFLLLKPPRPLAEPVVSQPGCLRRLAFFSSYTLMPNLAQVSNSNARDVKQNVTRQIKPPSPIETWSS